MIKRQQILDEIGELGIEAVKHLSGQRRPNDQVLYKEIIAEYEARELESRLEERDKLTLESTARIATDANRIALRALGSNHRSEIAAWIASAAAVIAVIVAINDG